jgi:MAC/Perforin domain-containing protein
MPKSATTEAEESTATEADEATTTAADESNPTDENFVSFLKKHSLSGDKVLGVLSEFGVESLYALKTAKEDPDTMGQIKEKLKGSPIANRALDALTVESIDNAIFFMNNSGAEAKARALADFLVEHDVLDEGEEWDKLLRILRREGVHSLETLRAKDATKLKALAVKIKNWNQEAGTSFEAITPAIVAAAVRGGQEASPELKAFIAKKRLPGETEKVLAEFGITTLDQLKEIKEDDTPGGSLDQLKTKLNNSGIRGAAKQLGDIGVADIEQEIAEANSPEAKAASEKSAELADAIKQAQELRERVEKTTDTAFSAVKTQLETDIQGVITKLNNVSGVEFESARAAALKSKEDLSTLLGTAISNATAAKGILNGVAKAPRPLAQIMTQQYMLCGFLITPDEIIKMHSALVKLPENPEKMLVDPGKQRTFSHSYKGSETKSFAASAARQASRTLASSAEASGATFVGSGVAAVTAAASYADAQQESKDSHDFESATTAKCGEIHYLYVPKQGVQFNKYELRLSDQANAKLERIAACPPNEQATLIKEFYKEYGSHFFLQCSLGGRYEFTATGESSSRTQKGQLISAVAETYQWAASASGSYAGLGGAATAAASVKGQKSVASAEGKRLALDFENAKVEVETEVLGGAREPAPRDVWAQSLRYNSTWAVIDRDQPIGVWELVRDGKVSSGLKALAPLLEKIWVREIFPDAVRESSSALYNYLKSNETITNCELLNRAVKEQRLEPPVEIWLAIRTSGRAEHPKVIAGLNEKGLKLIGGGATVDYGGGPGNLLTGSYPDGQSWAASAKSHFLSCLATVTAYAIYLYDPYDLWDVERVREETKARSNRPVATAKLPPGYVLTGGGALVDWGGYGMMLTACCPHMEENGTYTGWTAKAKDHKEGDGGNATAWAFGIRPKNGVKPTPPAVDQLIAPGSQLPTLELGAKPDAVILGGGAEVKWRGAGGMLTRCGLSPDNQKWRAQAKDHEIADGSLDLKIWVISRPGRLTKVSNV